MRFTLLITALMLCSILWTTTPAHAWDDDKPEKKSNYERMFGNDDDESENSHSAFARRMKQEEENDRVKRNKVKYSDSPYDDPFSRKQRSTLDIMRDKLKPSDR